VTPAAVRTISPFSRVVGFLADVLLLALFLVFGLALLNILIEVIVLVVGIVRQVNYQRELAAYAVKGAAKVLEPGRFKSDLIALAIAAGSALVSGGLYIAFIRLRRRYLHIFVEAGFESFVSKRYLIAREGGRLVGVISVVSVLGVAVGTMALIVVISVMQGFDDTLVKKFMGVFSHIVVQPDPRYVKDPIIPATIADDLMERLAKEPYVKGLSPTLDYECVIRNDTRDGGDRRITFAYIRGLDPEREKTVTDFISYIQQGNPIPGDQEVVLGSGVAQRLDVRVGQRVIAMGEPVQTANRIAVKQAQLKVVGIFNSGLFDVDDKFIYTNLKTVRDLRLIEEGVQGIQLKVDDPERVNEYAYGMLKDLPFGYGARTWQMLNPQFFEALWIEKVAMAIILLLIIIVAALNIIGTLVMTVVQKTRDIGVLKSMGATNGMILRIFLYHGFLIGLLGTSLGVVWGVRLCWFVSVDIEKIFKLPPGVYGIDRLPVVVDPVLIGIMALSALAICVGASIIPAWQAARLNPVEALRYD
jgi:lipoprotein-releasing system permease protein